MPPSSDHIKMEVASPCSASWEEMAGDERVRFCSLCKKNVYSLASMSTDNAPLSLDGEVCSRLYQRADGTVLTQDCPIGLRKQLKQLRTKAQRRWLALTSALVSVLTALVSLRALTSDEPIPALHEPARLTNATPPKLAPPAAAPSDYIEQRRKQYDYVLAPQQGLLKKRTSTLQVTLGLIEPKPTPRRAKPKP
jgi:hypothetical protein